MKYYFLVLCFCLCKLTYSQECNNKFYGEIHDFHDGSPIINATIYLKSINRYTTTDIDGKFAIKDICDGQVEVIISHIGCENKTLIITIQGDTFKTINMEHHIEELIEVEVKGNNTNKLTKTSQETLLKQKTIERYNNINLGDALKQISGVSSINTGNTIVKPIINGLHSSRIIITTNGVRLQDQEWGIEHAPNIDLNTVGNINVIKGSNALAYGGGAIGGIIVLNPQKIILKDSIYGKTIFSGQTNGQGVNISSSLSKTYEAGWFLNSNVSLKDFGDFKSVNYNLTNTGLKSKGFSINTGFKTFEKGFNIYYNYLTNTIGILKASHIGNIEDLVNAINNKTPYVSETFSRSINAPKQEVIHQVFKSTFYKRFKKLGRLELQYDYQNNQRYEFDIRVGDDKNKAALDLNLKTHNVSTHLKIDALKNVTYSFGINVGYQNNFANPGTGVRRLIPDYYKYDIGSFAIANLNLKQDTNLDFGLRYDFNRIDAKKYYLASRWEERNYNNSFSNIIIDDLGTQLLTNPIFNYHNISASIGLSHKFDDQNSILVNYGLTQRPPNPSELFSDGLHHSAARIELGDLDISKETSNRIATTYKFNSNSFSLQVEGFYNYINDFIYILPVGTEQTIRGAFPVWNFSKTNASLFGLDITANYLFNKQWTLNNKTSIIKGENISNSRPLIDIPAFKTINVITYTNKKWFHLNSELQSELVLKQSDYPNNNFTAYIATTGQDVLVNISTPPATYHLLHFQSDVTFDVSKKTKLNVSLNINNILNTSYREYLNRLRYFTDDLGRNFMLQFKFIY